MDFESFFTDHSAENEGTWVKLSSTARIKVARASDANEAYTSALRAKYKAHRFDLEQDDEISTRLQEEIMIELYADHILKDVEGMNLGGQPIVYTPEIGRKLLANKDFMARVRSHATSLEHFKQKAEDDGVKN